MVTTYQEYLKSDDWKRKRRSKRTAGKKCALCMSNENLHVHHLNYKNLTDVIKNDLRVLCGICHKKLHDLILEGKLKFESKDPHKMYKQIHKAFKKYHPECSELLKKGLQEKREIRNKYHAIEISPPKHPEITQLVTDEIIQMGKSINGGWNLKQLKLFGFNDFHEGWKEMIIGQEWPRETIRQFIYLKNKHLM